MTGAIDCATGINAHPSCYQVHNETDDTTDLTWRGKNFDKAVTNDTLCHQQYDAVNSDCSVAEWLQQQLSRTPICDNLQTVSPEHHRHQHLRNPHQQMSLAEWDKAVCQTLKLTGKQSSQAAKQKCSGAALTTEELRLLSGSAPCSLTYKGRRLRHIAPKPAPGTTAETLTHRDIQFTQHYQTLPKTTFSVIVGRPVWQSLTKTTSTSSNNTTAVSHDSSDGQLSPTGKKTSV